MPGFQERWIVGKTVERLEVRKRPTAWGSGMLIYDESCTIHFTDGSSLKLVPDEDDDNMIIQPCYCPAKRRK